MAVHDVARIEEKLDRAKAGATLISDALGGVLFQNMAEVLEFSKLMSLADVAVPKHLRGNPGACLRIVTQALEWRMSPFSVADQSYAVSDKIGYSSQLIHAVVEQRAPITGRIRHRFEGEGDERVCIVWAQVKGEAEPLEYRSPPFGKIQPKNSPLWKTKPDLQQYYNTSRDFCRVYFPDTLLGVYAEDELRDHHVGADRAKDVTPKPDIAKRLTAGKGKRGFDADHVERETSGEARSPAGHGATFGTESVTGTGRPLEPESGALSAPAPSSAASGHSDAGQAGTQVPPAQLIDDKEVMPVEGRRDSSRPEYQTVDAGGETRSHAGHMARPGTAPVTRTGGPPDEIAVQDAPASDAEARAVGDAQGLGGSPPSVFQQYADAIKDAPSPKDVAKAHNTFFNRHPLPDDEEIRNKFNRIRLIRLCHINGEFTEAVYEQRTREAVAS